MAMYLSFSTVVTCMRAGLYQTKNGLLVFLRIVAVEEVDDLGRDFLVDPLRSLERQRGPHPCTSGSWMNRRTCTTGRCAEASGKPSFADRPRPALQKGRGSACSCMAGQTVCWVGDLLMSGKLTPCNRIEVIQVAPIFLEAMRGRQCVGVVARDGSLPNSPVFVAEIEQELGERRGCRDADRTGCRAVAGDHAGAQRIHAGEEGVCAQRCSSARRSKS